MSVPCCMIILWVFIFLATILFLSGIPLTITTPINNNNNNNGDNTKFDCICSENIKRTFKQLLDNGLPIVATVSIDGLNLLQGVNISKDPGDNNYDGSYIIINDGNNTIVNTSIINGIRLQNNVFDINALNQVLVPNGQDANYVCSPDDTNSQARSTRILEAINLPFEYRVTFNNLRGQAINPLLFFFASEASIINGFPGVAFMTAIGSTANHVVMVNKCNINAVTQVIS